MHLDGGKYFIGDPCYVIRDGDWQRFCEEFLFDCDKAYTGDGYGVFDGRKVFAHGTAYGDGVYPATNNFEYGVDSGTIGAIPVELCDPATVEDAVESGLGTVENFPNFFHCNYEEGRFSFNDGELIIDTDPDGPSDPDNDQDDEEREF
jgi:hypothetical protein